MLFFFLIIFLLNEKMHIIFDFEFPKNLNSMIVFSFSNQLKYEIALKYKILSMLK